MRARDRAPLPLRDGRRAARTRPRLSAAILAELAGENPNHLYALEDAVPETEAWFRRRSIPSGETVVLEQQFREPAGAVLALRQRAGAGAGGCARGRAPARRGRGAGGDLRADRRPGATRRARSRRRWRSAASPSTSPGPAALFQRPEVRDAIAWLRVLAEPDDSAAAARALTRPPIELRSADLARLTTIARRRKVDMVSACEAALESPQIPPEARERIQAFLKLYGEASAALEERRADVFVRRLIERVGLRRQRLFAAQPEVAERLLASPDWPSWPRPGRGGSRMGRPVTSSATSAPSPRPGSSRPAARSRPRRGRCSACDRAPPREWSSTHVFVLGLEGSDEGSASAARLAPAWCSPGSSSEPASRPRPSTRRRSSPRAERGGRTRRSCSGPPRACTPPTASCARRCWRPPGRRAGSSRSRASTPRSTSTGRSPATWSC